MKPCDFWAHFFVSLLGLRFIHTCCNLCRRNLTMICHSFGICSHSEAKHLLPISNWQTLLKARQFCMRRAHLKVSLKGSLKTRHLVLHGWQGGVVSPSWKSKIRSTQSAGMLAISDTWRVRFNERRASFPIASLEDSLVASRPSSSTSLSSSSSFSSSAKNL